jgi:hypothetical protein
VTAQKFRKKPVEIEAWQWDGTALGATPIINWINDSGGTATYWCDHATNCGDDPHFIRIRTLEGDMFTSPQDWVIRGVKGEFYPCRVDIFEATYDQVA